MAALQFQSGDHRCAGHCGGLKLDDEASLLSAASKRSSVLFINPAIISLSSWKLFGSGASSLSFRFRESLFSSSFAKATRSFSWSTASLVRRGPSCLAPLGPCSARLLLGSALSRSAPLGTAPNCSVLHSFLGTALDCSLWTGLLGPARSRLALLGSARLLGVPGAT